MTNIDTSQLYLSRLRLNPRHRGVWRCMSNSQRMHALLLRGFLGTDRETHNMLFRPDPVKGNREGLIDVIVQSTIEPDWAYLREEGMLHHESEFFGDGLVKNISTLPERLQVDDIFRFRLRANPTKRMPWKVWAEQHPEKARVYEKNSRRFTAPRVPVTMLTGEDLLLPEDERPSADDKLHEWLVRKGQMNGFLVARVESRPDPISGDMQRGEKRGDDDSSISLSHKAIVYEGLLKITDSEDFRHAVLHGIGSGKSYGFGLLSLAPAGGV